MYMTIRACLGKTAFCVEWMCGEAGGAVSYVKWMCGEQLGG